MSGCVLKVEKNFPLCFFYKQKKNIHPPGIEPGTYRVLGGRHNQLDHGCSCNWADDLNKNSSAMKLFFQNTLWKIKRIPFSFFVETPYIWQLQWPSGLRRSTQVRVSSEAWVRTPPEALFLFWFFIFKNIGFWNNFNIETSVQTDFDWWRTKSKTFLYFFIKKVSNFERNFQSEKHV